MTKRLLVFLFFSAAIYAGQSFVFTSAQTISNASVPAQTGAWSKEFYLDSTPDTSFLYLILFEGSTGINNLTLFGCAGTGVNCIDFTLDGVNACGGARIGTGVGYPNSAAYFRIQHDLASLGAGHSNTDYCEIWDSNGVERFKGSVAYTSASSTSAGASMAGNSNGQHLAFVRLCSGAILPLGSKMPTTAGGCPTGTEVYEWKFDGNLNDSSGHRFNATLSSGSASYATTLFQNVIAVLKTFGAPFWTNWVAMRAGHPNRLDGTSSLSQADTSSTVTCFWQMLAAASVPTWDSHTSCTPTLTGLVFGSYTAQLTATDATGAQAVTTLQIGAVAYDDNGVVINSTTANQMFGPMLAFGKNPWALQDKLAMDATVARSAAYNMFPGIPPTWDVPLPGTVTYSFNPVSGTTFASACHSTDATCTLTNAAVLDLSTLPTSPVILMIGGQGSISEFAKICSVSGNVITFCYDGRAYHFGAQFHNAAQATWPAGTTVQSWQLKGSGTSLLATFNALGAGWAGKTIGTAGTCQVVHNSAAIVGTGTAWTSNPNAGRPIRISGHHGGVAFEFFAYVSSVTDATHLTVNRVYPNDADDESGLTCATFTDDRYAIVEFLTCGSGAYAGCDTTSDGGSIAWPYDGVMYLSSDGCYSDTSCFLYGGFDPGAFFPNNSPSGGACPSSSPPLTIWECGVHISYMDGLGYVADNGGVNFYDEGLAHMALYLRSGWQPALDAFRKVEGQEGTANRGYMFYPEMLSTNPRRVSLLGMEAAYLFDGKVSNLSGLRRFAHSTISNTTNFTNCNAQDLRESIGYPLQWLAAAALWDPSSVSLGYPTALANWYATYSPCSLQSDPSPLVGGSWSTGGQWNSNQTPALTATTGSAVLTGTGIPSAICGKSPSATGTATVTKGSDVVTGSGFVTGGGKIMFEDSLLGLISFDYIFDNSGQVHLSGTYPGASAPGVTWLIRTDDNTIGIVDSQLVFGASNNDAQLKKQWACTWNNSSQITLDRNWDGPNETVYGWSGGGGGVILAGFGTQPFFLGVNVLGHRLASLIGGSMGANFNSLGVNAAAWLKANAYDPISGGTTYARIYAGCEPPFGNSSQPQNFGFRNPGCSFSGSSALPNQSDQTARVVSVEIGNTATLSFANDSSSTNKSFWDTFYANIWDVAPYTAAGFGSDGIGSSNCGPQQNFSQGKWTGYCFGIGMSHQWPAARIGGVLPPLPRTLEVSCNISSVANATKCRVTLTKPDGSIVTNTCTSSPCAVTADAREGDHLLKVDYLSASGAVLSSGAQTIVPVQ
jgi:hypothetical protein